MPTSQSQADTNYMFATNGKRSAPGSAQASTIKTLPTSPIPRAASQGRPVRFQDRATRFTFIRTSIVCAALAIASSAFGQNETITPFKLETADWYIQVGIKINPTFGPHVFTPPAGPGLWCTPAEMVLNSIDSVTARDYPLCPGPNGILQRTRHDSAPHSDDIVPSSPWQFSITCPVPGPPFGARESRVKGARTHPGAGHTDEYAAVVGALVGTAPGPSLEPRLVIIHGSIGHHSTYPPQPGNSPMVGGCSLQPPCGLPTPGDQDYPAGELLTMVNQTTGETLLLLVADGVTEENLGGVYVRDGLDGTIVADLRGQMETHLMDSNTVVLTINNGILPVNAAQLIASGNAYIEVQTTAHPDGRIVGQVSALGIVGYYQVPIQTGWNVIANQLSRGSNTLAEVLPSVPNGTIFYRWNADVQGYQSSSFRAAFNRWSIPTLSFAPGEGGFLRNPGPASTLTFVGETVMPQLPVTLPTDKLVLVANQIPTPATYEQITGRPPSEGTKVYRYDPATSIDPLDLSTWKSYSFSGGQWAPGTPGANIGEPMFIQVPSPVSPTIDTQPQSQAVAAGTDVTLSVQVSGPGPISYQWQLNSVAILDATNSSLLVTNVQSSQAGAYTVTISNAWGGLISNPAELAVNNPPIIEQVAPIMVHQGETMNQTVTAWDPDGNHLSCSVDCGSLSGVRIDPATGVLTLDGTQSPGTYLLKVDVADDGMPVLHAQQTVSLVVGAPILVHSVTQTNREITLTWNSLPGRQYVVHSTRSLIDPDWDYRATITADSDTTTWTALPFGNEPAVFYEISTASCSCTCAGMAFHHVEPNRDAKIQFKVANDAKGRPDSATVEVPFRVAADLTCNRGSVNCTGHLKVSASGNWWIINAAGVIQKLAGDGENQTGEITATGGADVSGPCGVEAPLTTRQTPDVTLKVSLDLTKNAVRDKLKAGGGGYLRVEIKVSISTVCNGFETTAKTVTIMADGRSDDAAAGRNGGFDHENSDFDADGKLGNGERAAGAIPTDKSPDEIYKNDYDPAIK